MNSNEASFNGGLVSNQIILQIFICDNNTKEIDSHSIWDDNEKWRDEGWNHRRDNDPKCYPPKIIREFLKAFEPVVEIFGNQQFINFDSEADNPIQTKFIPFDSFRLKYESMIQADIIFAVNNVHFYENPYTIYPQIDKNISFLELDEFTHYYLKGKRDEDEYDNKWTSSSI